MISFVVPVYQVQDYLRRCLDSILEQSYTDVEVIAVDDCSPDDSGTILAGYAARDPRVRVIRSAGNEGPGPARERGLAAATGDHVWFLDGDDWLAPGAVRAVADRLRHTAAEVLIVGHADAAPDGATWRTGRGPALHRAPEVFALRDWPAAIDVLHVPWNKVVRRSLLDRLDFRFRPGWYEDVPFTYALLLAAERISTLDRVCVFYRQRAGAATATAGGGHFGIFPNWARVFDSLDDSRPETARLRPLLFRRMVWHFIRVRGNDDRLESALRPGFFTEMTAMYHRYLPPGGYPVPGGLEGIRHRLVAGGRHGTFLALRRTLRGVRMVRRGGRRGVVALADAARRLRDLALAGYYRLQLRRPVDPALAVYAAYWYRGYACNPAAVYEKARELAPAVRGVWVVRRDRAGTLPAGVEHVVAGSPGYYRVLARAKWLINNVNWPNPVVKRPGAVHVMTHHGTPLKVMGLDQRAYPDGVQDPDFDAQIRRAGRWDFSVTANPHTTRMWRTAYPCRHTTLETGYPRNDRLATATAGDVARARTALGLTAADRVVLYAPTHREHRPGREPYFEPETFVEALGPTGRLLVRSHYFHDRSAPTAGPDHADRVRDVSAHPSVEELCLAADVLVTDYSSVMFDYAVLDRPIVVYAPDWPAYRAERGVYFDVMAEPPGVVADTFAELLDLVRADALDGAAARSARAAFRARFCALEDGRAAERVVRRVFLDSGPGRPPG
ncbi:bifunctional glycosyltransferase family 2 protein/CDP-glycerol:glycerophosphate glycerophosphotransferase [Polymorphospora sp. NPDC050346]|uniref:bifunctional glycosyltransferase/CDP-glycerol:glycerophosphate glycerophosphotransferase n=1 Tax=Polymorphospora sp. NPDC050346 TaxID=3155780 RepID=UPI0033D12A96